MRLFSDNQSFVIQTNQETKEVAIKVIDTLWKNEVVIFINKKQWEEIKPKIDNAFNEM